MKKNTCVLTCYIFFFKLEQGKKNITLLKYNHFFFLNNKHIKYVKHNIYGRHGTNVFLLFEHKADQIYIILIWVLKNYRFNAFQ